MTDSKKTAEHILGANPMGVHLVNGRAWLVEAIAAAITAAVEEERELNAKYCEVYAYEADVMGHHDRAHTARHLATTIRSRAPASPAPATQLATDPDGGVRTLMVEEPAPDALLEAAKLRVRDPYDHHPDCDVVDDMYTKPCNCGHDALVAAVAAAVARKGE